MTIFRSAIPDMAAALVLGLLCFASGASAGWIEERDGRTILHIRIHDWIYPEAGRTDAAARADAAAIKAFTRNFPEVFAERYRDRYKAHPEIYGHHNWDSVDVEAHEFAGLKVRGVETDLLAIAGKVAPDVIYINFRKSDTYIQQSFLYPLDNPDDGYLSSMTLEELEFRVNPKIWPVIKRKGPMGKQHVWALPYGGALGRVAFFRKDIFDNANVPYPHNDWTWDDLHDICKRVANPAEGIYAIQFTRGLQESWYWVSYLWSSGAEIMTFDEARGQWDIKFDVPAAAEALDFYTRLNTEPWTDSVGRKRYGYAYKDLADSYAKWLRGEIAIATGYIDGKLFSDLNPDVTGMVPVPIGPTGIRATELNARMMGLFSGIEEPAIRDAAWEFIRYYDSYEAVEIKTRVLVEGGLGRFIIPQYLRMFGYDELVRLAPKGWEEVFDITFAAGKPEPYGRHGNIIYDILTEPLHRAQELALEGKLPEDKKQRLAVLYQLLRRAGDKARYKMLGEVPPDILKRQRITALIFLFAILAVFALLFRRILQAFAPPEALQTSANEAVQRQGWQFSKYAKAYVILLPALLTVLVWQYIPLLRGSVMAFQDYNIMGDSKLVWLDNFGHVLWDRDWWSSVWNAVRYSFLVVALTFLPPIVLAIILQEIPYGKTFFRTVFYLPAVITSLVVIYLWKSFYDPSEAGVLNAIIMKIPVIGYLAVGGFLFYLCYTFASRLHFHGRKLSRNLFCLAGLVLLSACLGLAWPAIRQPDVPIWERLFVTLPEPYRWLSDTKTAMLACVVPMVWAGIGPGCLIYLAALKGVADDYYEAADMDGATFIDKILFVVFPILKPLILINFIGVFIGSWYGATANILAMTAGAANTKVAGLHIFYEAFIYLKFGPATAMAWVLGFLLIGFTVHQLRILSRLEFKTTGDKE
jgi:ABC-type sugar transport system permease subunit/ABC-type glycerol-3-phosphate transport system substrate-binding protein